MPAFKRLTYTDKLRLETLHNAGKSAREIAGILSVHPSTVYRELKRGEYERLNSDLTTRRAYSADISDQRYRYLCSACGAPLKIGACHDLARFIEDKICDDHYSPDAVLGLIRSEGIYFPVTICTSTLYSYIDKGVFGRLSNRDLLRKGKRKRPYHHVHRVKRAPRGTSIERRPDPVNERLIPGHWEMDLVIGTATKGRVLLTLTERYSRYEIIRVLPDKTTASVVRALDILERRYGSTFPDVFQSITVDNGSEFADCAGLERSVFGGARTKVYYAHPYSSWERGTNEHTNGMIRRFIPKGKSMKRVTQKQADAVADWLNNYPRRKLGYSSAEKIFSKNFRKTT